MAATNTSSAAAIDTVVESRADVAPRLRTLLLTDLCNSTELVEKLGDGRSAGLFQAHDRLVLELQQRWRARLIDRSDGLLLLFERAVDGLGFALDYVRGLRDLGKEHGAELQARAGLHVGEVLTWQNSTEAVNLGAKPLEVEGLAKPMAARLMTLARPGQILVSAVAEPLAHRAARELGPRGEQLLWKSWGRWRFKGVPGAQEIFEVGEAGLAPLRIPRNGPKAWRDIPLWRRPAALAAEAALLAGLAVGAWFATRPQPAIAFAERDWVVVGDLRNITGDERLDDALEQAFRISLEQSRYVNVLSDLKARDTLGRMRRPASTALDRAIASEIALRDGARAVILPTVAEVGGKVRITAEVVDPHTQATVYTEIADGTGEDSTLNSIDRVAASLRGRLGEAVASIQKDSLPLPQVSTGSLDALKLYALGQQAYAKGSYEDANRLYQRATDLDPKFALAWIGQMRTYYARNEPALGLSALRKAQSLKGSLAPRERFYLDAWSSDFENPATTAARWEDLAKLYPDFFPALGNATYWLFMQNRMSEASRYIKRALLPQNELQTTAMDLAGRVAMATGRFDEAKNDFKSAISRGYDSGIRRLAANYAAQRNFVEARKTLSKAGDNPYAGIDGTTIDLDAGSLQSALKAARRGHEQVKNAEGVDRKQFLLILATAAGAQGDKSGASSFINSAIEENKKDLLKGSDFNIVDDAVGIESAVFMKAVLGDSSGTEDVLRIVAHAGNVSEHPVVRELAAVLRAEQQISEGKPDVAIRTLSTFVSGHERYETHITLLRAAIAAKQDAFALRQAKWLQNARGLAYIQGGCGQCLQSFNVLASTRAIEAESQILARQGKNEEASASAARFQKLWSADNHLDFF